MWSDSRETRAAGNNLPPRTLHNRTLSINAVRNLDVAQVPSARDHVRLMAALAQPRNLPQAQPALEEAHCLIVQKIVHPTAVELGATTDEPSLIDATAMALAIGQYIEAILDHRLKQLRAPAAAVEDDGDLSLTDHVAHFAQQPGHGLRQGSIDLAGNHQQRIARTIVDPVVRRGRHRQMAARNVGI